MIGPKHYEGWSCNDCDFIRVDLDGKMFDCCNEPLIAHYKIDDRNHTPNWCPYLRYAIVRRVMECDDE